MNHALFERFGLADASVAAAGSPGIVVLTTDDQLYLELTLSGQDAINFNHVRMSGWSY